MKPLLAVKPVAIPTANRVNRIHYAIRGPLEREADQLESMGKPVIRLNIGDPGRFGFEPPAELSAAASSAFLGKGKWSYPEAAGEKKLRELLAQREGVAPEKIIVTAGLSEGIDFLYKMLVNPGDNILLPRPCYSLYSAKNGDYGATENYYDTWADFSPNVESIAARIDSRTKAVVVINPNNPTGKVYSPETLASIFRAVSEVSERLGRPIPIFADEIYSELGLDGQQPVSMKDIVEEGYPIIRGCGISKNFMAPGARVGYLAFHGDGMENLVAAAQKFCGMRLGTVKPMHQSALALYTLPEDASEKYFAENRLQLAQRRDLVFQRLNEIPGMYCVRPEAAFYAFPRIDHTFHNDALFAEGLLHEKQVLVVPGSGFGMSMHFRLVFLPDIQVLNQALDRIDAYAREAIAHHRA